jgi:hypothetical protein
MSTPEEALKFLKAVESFIRFKIGERAYWQNKILLNQFVVNFQLIRFKTGDLVLGIFNHLFQK